MRIHLKARGPDRGVVLFRFVAVRLIIVFGPLALWDGLAGKLVEGLPREVLTSPADAYPIDLAAADVHGSDAAVALHLEGGLVAFPERAESRDESGHGSSGRRPGKKRRWGHRDVRRPVRCDDVPTG